MQKVLCLNLRGEELAQNLYLSSIVDRQVVVDLNPMVDIKLVETAIIPLFL